MPTPTCAQGMVMSARIAGNKLQRTHWYMQPVTTRIFQRQEISGDAVKVEMGEPTIAPDAIIDVHNR